MRFILAALLACPLFAAPRATTLQQAESAWQHRDLPGRTEEAITLWQQALRGNPRSTEMLIALTHACGRAVRHASTKKEMRQWADQARAYGEQAVAQAPQNADAYTVYGEALAQWANAHKGVHSLGAVRKAVKALEKAVQLNPRQSHAHMLLAELYRLSPRAPISVGNKRKGFLHAQLAVTSGGQYAINHLVFARALLEKGDRDAARKELQAIVALTPPSDAIPETRSDQETAREMLQKL